MDSLLLHLWSLLRDMNTSHSRLNTSGSRNGRSQGPTSFPSTTQSGNPGLGLSRSAWCKLNRESDASGNHYTDGRWHLILGVHALLEKLKPRNIS